MDRDDTMFASYVLHLWRKRYVILGGTILFMLIAAIYVQFIAKPVYTAYAQIMAKQKPTFTDADRLALSPITYEAMVKSDDILRKVIDTYQARYKVSMKLELFRKAIKIKTLVAEDTSVRKVYSQVILLSLKGNTPESAKELMDIWTALIIEEYGNLLAQEAQYMSLYYKQKIGQIESQLQEKEKELAKIRWEMPNKIKELVDKENLLAPAQVSYDFRGSQRDLRRFVAPRQEVAVQLTEQPELPKEGLNARLAKVQIDIAKDEALATQYPAPLKTDQDVLRFVKDASKETLQSLLTGKISDQQMTDLLTTRDGQPLLAIIKTALSAQARLEGAQHTALGAPEEKRAEANALKQRIEATQQEIARLQTEVAALQQQYETRLRDVEALNEKHRLARDWQAQVEIEGDARTFAQDNKTEGVELKILASAAIPDIRSYPKKALMTLIAGAIGFLLSSLVVILNRYIKDAAETIAPPR